MKIKKISEKEILHLAKLANLHLTKEEIARFQNQLSDIVNYIEQLKKVDTRGVLPIAQLTELVNANREDAISAKRTLLQSEATKNAKNKKNGYFAVKSLFETNE